MTKIPVIAMLFMLGTKVSGMKCYFDSRCQCRVWQEGKSLFKADCSHQHLKTVPNFEDDVIKIDLSFNNIQDIVDGKFENNSRLLEMDLSFNLIQSIGSRAFIGLVSLTMLFVNNNNISKVDEESFSLLKNLRVLNFKVNPVDSLSLNFTETPSLVTVKMDFTPMKSKRNHFWGMPYLRDLDVSGFTGNCKVVGLTEKTFHLLPNLETIDLSSCSLNFIENGTFRKLPNLTFLDVSYNRCLKFAGIQNVTDDLPYTSIKILNLSKVHQTFEMNTKITRRNFQFLQNTSLEEIRVESNRIQLIDRGVLTKFPSTLRKIYMGDNEFSYGSYFEDVSRVSVQFVNLSSLFASHSPTEKPEHCESVEYCRLKQCNVPESLTEVPGLMSFRVNQDGDRLPLFLVPPNLTALIYTHCNVRYEIPGLILSSNRIEFIDASFNIFYSWIGPLVGLNFLKYLDLSYNFCGNLSSNFFEKTKNLRTLYIQNNLLGFVIPEYVNDEIFQNVTELEDINLSFNRIASIPWKLFKSQTRMKYLNISYNMLDDITFQLSHMTDLLILDLSSNRFSSLDGNAREQIRATITSSFKMKLDISGNPLLCTCDTIDFIKWVAENKFHFRNLKSTYCQHQKIKMNFENIEVIQTELEKKCSSYISLIITIVAAIVLFIAILSWGLIYRYRWKLRYLYYMIKSKHQGSVHAPTCADTRIYEYDAFISYADKDSKFVHEKLIDYLENKFGLRLCIHKRDFLPGNDIASNITSAIHASRKVVIIMTDNFLDSYWCMFEYNMARMESIYAREKENILFLVFLDQVHSSNMPLYVMELVQSRSYIEFPDDPHGDTIFWEKLKEVLTP